MVAWCLARSGSLSRSGIGVRPSILVKMTVWLLPGRVYSALSAAAVAKADDTPGTTSYPIPSSSSLSICSLCAP